MQRRRLPAPVREGSAVGREIDAVVLGGAVIDGTTGVRPLPSAWIEKMSATVASPDPVRLPKSSSDVVPGSQAGPVVDVQAVHVQRAHRAVLDIDDRRTADAIDRMHDGQRPTIRRPVGPGEVGQGLLQTGRTPDPSGAAIISVASWGDTVRRNVSCVPSRVYPTAKSSVGPVMTAWAWRRRRDRAHQDVAVSLVDDLAVGGQTERRRRTRWTREPTATIAIADRTTMRTTPTRSALPSVGRARKRGCAVRSTGSHLSRLDHAGRWRSVAGPSEDGIEVLRHPMLGIRVEPLGDVAVEAVARVHAGRPSRMSGPGRASASSAARICFRPRYRRDLVVPSGIPSVAATSGNGRSR